MTVPRFNFLGPSLESIDFWKYWVYPHFMSDTKDLHSISYVSNRTGLSEHTIRVWERRYAAVKPVRAASGHRLFRESDIERLFLLNQAVKAGHSIGKVAMLDSVNLRELLCTTYDNSKTEPVLADEYLRKCCEAVEAMMPDALERELLSANVKLSQFELLNEVFAPLMGWIEESRGVLSLAQQQCATATIRGFLERLRDSMGCQESSRIAVITTPARQSHEVGALFGSILAAMDGWRAIYLGPNLPADEIADTGIDMKAKAIVISLDQLGMDHETLSELVTLKGLVPPRITLVCGGPGGTALQDELNDLGYRFASDFTSYRKILGSIAG